MDGWMETSPNNPSAQGRFGRATDHISSFNIIRCKFSDGAPAEMERRKSLCKRLQTRRVSKTRVLNAPYILDIHSTLN